MVNELDRLLELAVACGRANLRIAISILADTGRGKTQRLRQFAEAYNDNVYYIPENTTAYKIQQTIRDMAGHLDAIVLDDFSWVPEFDKHNMVTTLRGLYDGVLSKDSKEEEGKIIPVPIHSSLIIANNEKTIRSRFIKELENQGIIDRFIPFRYTHSAETDKYIRLQQAKARNKTPPTVPRLKFNADLPKRLRDCVCLDDTMIEEITEKYKRSRWSDQMIGLKRVAMELDYEEHLKNILEFIGNNVKEMDVLFEKV